MLAWPYVYKNISKDYDWYYKGEDDGYLVVENLRSFLRNYNPDEPHYFGTWFKPYLPKGFNSGAGYVFSRGTLKKLVEALDKDPKFCPNADYEDLGVATCLNKLNITPGASVDSNGYHRFLPYSFHEIYSGFARDWYVHNISQGFDAFGPELIQLHHNTPLETLLIDAMLYRVKVKDLNKKN
uniref:N-acetylgalactosaminide beta-1,3-galactosyltransferase n=1 Tax=Acrobeloides nanus TaxID=290746 RepID=A0A914C1J9_9BILA